MSLIPDFLIKRVFKKGSLRKTDEGVAFDLKNVLGPGIISGVSFIKINDITFGKDVIKFITQGMETFASKISEESPITFRLGQEGTLVLCTTIECLKDGLNQIIINLTNPEAGNIEVSLSDNYKKV